MIKNYQKSEVLRFGFFMFLSVLLFTCKDDKTLSAQDIVKRSIEAHGGLEKWESLKQLSFDKETTLFYDDGSTQIHTEQFQLFRLQPSLFGKLEWEIDSNSYSIVYDKDKVSKTVNDSIVTSEDELNSARNSFFAAYHVTQQPFALLHDDVILTNKGEVTIDGKTMYEVYVNYDNDTEDSDQWIYYFDTETFEVLRNKVILTDHTSWVENLTFDTTTDFKLNAHRKSYRLNEAGKKTYLRAEYFYTNYSVLY